MCFRITIKAYKSVCNKTICCWFHLTDSHVNFTIVCYKMLSLSKESEKRLLFASQCVCVEMCRFKNSSFIFPLRLSLLWIEFLVLPCMITPAEIEEKEQSSGNRNSNNSSIDSFNTVATQAHIHLSNLFIYLFRLDFRFKFITNLKLVCLFACIDCGRVDSFFALSLSHPHIRQAHLTKRPFGKSILIWLRL